MTLRTKKPRKELRRKAWKTRGTKPLPKVNPARQAKRRKRYKAAISSPRFKALRLAVFARDGWRCTVEIAGVRCPAVDETRTGKGLVAEHRTYARFGRELLEDLTTRCTACDRRQTPLERVNHSQGLKR